MEISKYRYKSKRRRNATQRRRANRIKRSIRRHVRANRLSLAARILARREVRRLLDPVEMDILRGRIGAGWFYYGNDRKALAFAGPAAKRSGRHAPSARWYAGLAAYRAGRHGVAAVHFEALAGSQRISRWTTAAAAFWAARSNMTAGRPARVTGLLGAAAAYPRTFYGILAARILGLGSGLDWERSTLRQSHVAAMLADKRARRALALIQVGQKIRAGRELRAQTMGGDPALIVGLLAVAEQAGLPALALRAAGALASGGGEIHARALYPVPHWKPRGGFVIDRALIYAFMRQESAFKVRAKSRSGARGLMQLMPATAGFMAKRRFRGRGRDKLFEPGLNLALGQKYLGYLIEHDQVQGDIFRLAAAYNGGPGNLAKWHRRAARNSLDPLMFIESIPARETRLFIERVLANLWIYRERLGQPAPSLDAIAAGERPVYRGLDEGRVADARN